MKNKFALLFSILFLVLAANGQMPFLDSDYPADQFQIKTDSFNFRGVNIEIRNVKRLVSKGDTSIFDCRGFLVIRKKDQVVGQKFFKNIHNTGECAGIFFPEIQPRKDVFLLSKFGDGEAHVLLVDSSGKLSETTGGDIFLSRDKRYLFSNFASDSAGLTVYDLDKRAVLFSDKIAVAASDWYFKDGQFFSENLDFSSEENEIKVVRFDIASKQVSIQMADHSLLKGAVKLKEYNNQEERDCDCGN